MSTKWSTQVLGQSGSSTGFGELLKDEYAIIFLQGKNTFDDIVYCYVKVMLPDIDRMHAILDSGAGFNPSDFGTVVAAGKGEPTMEVKGELSMLYPMLSQPKSMNLPNMPISAPLEKRAWDEY
jgi:hypothetical protein